MNDDFMYGLFGGFIGICLGLFLMFSYCKDPREMKYVIINQSEVVK